MDERWMGEALHEAAAALDAGEVPVGAVVVKEGAIVGRGRNEIEGRGTATAHAEMLALESAAKQIGDWRLDGCTLYVTVEPCHMCMGACYLSRVSRIVFGARQPGSGACGSHSDFHEARLFNHGIEVTGEMLAERSLDLMQRFFQQVRSEERERRDARAG